MILKDLFSDISGFAEFVPGIDSNTSFASLNSHAVTAYKRIANIISVPVYEKILDEKRRISFTIIFGRHLLISLWQMILFLM